MQRTLTHLGTAACLFALAYALAPAAHACSVDAGVWAAPMDASGVLTPVPRNGALVVYLTCSASGACIGDPLATVGSVLDPSGKEVAGHWTLHAGDVVAFVPNSPFDLGSGYKVQLKGASANERSFDVVAGIEAPKPEAFEASLRLSSVFRGAPGSYTCCTTDSCGSGCYDAQQEELAQLSLYLSRTPATSVLDQLELRAVSSDKAELVSSCVGCFKLPELFDHEAREKYCVELSARMLGTGTEIALGRVCTADGRASLATRAVPPGEIPMVCRAGGDAGLPQDAGRDVAVDASTGAPSDLGEAGAAERADAETAASTGSPADVGASNQASESEEPASNSEGCSATRRDARNAWSLVLLALLVGQRVWRRRMR